jgi:translocation and assembly module TamA
MKLNTIKTHFIFIFLFLSSVSQAGMKISIQGVNSEIENNINAYLGTTDFDCQATQSQVDVYVENIHSKILKAMRPFGYYNPSINATLLPKSKDCRQIIFNIELGKPIIINNIQHILSGDGKDNQDFKNLDIQFPLKKDKILVDDVYDKYKSSLMDKATELGYIDAKFIKSQIDVFPDKYQADVFLHFDTGIRYKIKKIEIAQTPIFLNERFISKMVTLKQGDYFKNSQLYQLRKKLTSTGYFDQVSIEVDYDHRDQVSGSVPIVIKLTPGNRIKYSTGIGFSTDTGPRVSFDYKQDRITDFGYQFNSKFSLSSIISEVSTGIKIPTKSQPLAKWYNLDVGFRRERTDTASSNTTKVGLSQTRLRENKWQNINFIDVVNEKFDIGAEGQRNSLLIVPGTSWSYSKADNPRVPMKGYKIHADVRGASDALLSDVSFVQINFSYKSIYPLGSNRLIYRGQLGTTLINQDISQLPSSYRYYTGGDNSIRGYNFNTLSPVNTAGDAIGGKHLFISSLEYEQRMGSQWALAVFTDVGNAFSDNFTLKKSVGAGLRWFSPIGPVRFDVGFPLNNDKTDFQIHITVGPDL